MTMVLRIAAIIFGLLFLIPGFVGVFRPERLAEALFLVPETDVGWVTIQVLIGAPYIAMSLVTLYGAIRGQWALLAPVAAIEGVMALTRTFSGFTYGFEAAGIGTIIIEVVVCVILGLAATLPARAQS
ncbi:MAG: hypothetical protein AAFR33_06440 [Pseudomonadota bacterium]